GSEPECPKPLAHPCHAVREVVRAEREAGAQLAEPEPVESPTLPPKLAACGSTQAGRVNPDPATVPRPQASVEVAPRADLPRHALRPRPETIGPPLVALDEAAGEQAGQGDADRVLADGEQLAGRDQRPHRHGAARKRREQVENEVPGGGGRHGDLITWLGPV